MVASWCANLPVLTMVGTATTSRDDHTSSPTQGILCDRCEDVKVTAAPNDPVVFSTTPVKGAGHRLIGLRGAPPYPVRDELDPDVEVRPGRSMQWRRERDRGAAALRRAPLRRTTGEARRAVGAWPGSRPSRTSFESQTRRAGRRFASNSTETLPTLRNQPHPHRQSQVGASRTPSTIPGGAFVGVSGSDIPQRPPAGSSALNDGSKGSPFPATS